eukprot:scaffold81552_cov27-Phaeocystis_antarctica.AAC.1
MLGFVITFALGGLQAGSKCPLGSAKARAPAPKLEPPSLAALGGSERAAPLGAQPLPWVPELAASKAAHLAASVSPSRPPLPLGALLHRFHLPR